MTLLTTMEQRIESRSKSCLDAIHQYLYHPALRGSQTIKMLVFFYAKESASYGIDFLGIRE